MRNENRTCFLEPQSGARGSRASTPPRLLGGLQRARELADYDPAVEFSSEDARQHLEDARSFAREALEILGREGWLAPGSSV